MSRPEKAAEPSMDEILASIRRIISEEPAGARPPSAQPLQAVPPSQPVGLAGKPWSEPNSARRFEPALSPYPPSSVPDNAVPMAAPIEDDDILDLVEEAPTATSRPAGLSFGSPPSPFAARPGLGSDRPSYLPPSRGEFDATPTPAFAVPVPVMPLQPRTLPFPFGPKTPKPRAAAMPAPLPIEPEDDFQDTGGSTSDPAELSEPLEALEPSQTETVPPAGEAPGAGFLARLSNETSVPPASEPAPSAPTRPASVRSGVEGLLAALRGPSSTGDAAEAPAADPTLPGAMDTPESDPFIVAQADADGPVASFVADPVVAIAPVLDDEAVAGIAGTGDVPSADGAALPAELSLVPLDQPVEVVIPQVAEGAVVAAVVLAPAPATATMPAEVLPPAPVAVRTLEDTVAELLKPMLRQWLDNNMPRIVEKALKEELAPAPKANGI